MSKIRKLKPATSEEISSLQLSQVEIGQISELLGHQPSRFEGLAYSIFWDDQYTGSRSKMFKDLVEEKHEQRCIKESKKERIVVGSGASDRFISSDSFFSSQLCLETAILQLAEKGAKPISAGISLQAGSLVDTEEQRFFIRAMAGVSSYCNKVGLPVSIKNFSFARNSASQKRISSFVFGSIASSESSISDKPLGLYFVGKPLECSSKEKENNSLTDWRVCQVYPNSTKIFGIIEFASELTQSLLSRKIVATGGNTLASWALKIAESLDMSVVLDLDRIPRTGEENSEDLFSANPSQRLLVAAPIDNYRAIRDMAVKWGLSTFPVGEVEKGFGFRVLWKHEQILDMPVRRSREAVREVKYPLLHSPPMVKMSPRHENVLDLEIKCSLEKVTEIPIPTSLADTWVDMLANPSLSSEPLALQNLFDIRIGDRLKEASQQSSVLQCQLITGDLKNYVFSLVSTNGYIKSDVYLGSAHLVANAIRELATYGSKPLFASAYWRVGPPEKYAALCDFSESVRGISDACVEWSCPLKDIDFNVEVENSKKKIQISASVALIGELAQKSPLRRSFESPGDRLLVIGNTFNSVSLTDYAFYCHQIFDGDVPKLDYNIELTSAELVRELVNGDKLKSALAIGRGGLAVAFAHASLCAKKPLGAKLEIQPITFNEEIRPDAVLFGESPGRYLITCSPEDEQSIFEKCAQRNIPVTAWGEIGGKKLQICGAVDCSLPLTTAYKVWSSRLVQEAQGFQLVGMT